MTEEAFIRRGDPRGSRTTSALLENYAEEVRANQGSRIEGRGGGGVTLHPPGRGKGLNGGRSVGLLLGYTRIQAEANSDIRGELAWSHESTVGIGVERTIRGLGGGGECQAFRKRVARCDAMLTSKRRREIRIRVYV